MPPPRKIDLLPPELRERLTRVLGDRGFGDIVAVTEELNFWLEEEGLQLRIGKSAVGDFSKALKDQREAFALAETLLDDMDVERESDMHKVLMQLIATAAVKLMASVKEGESLSAQELMNLGRMLKDIMGSAGIREKLRKDERERIAREAREAEAERLAGELQKAVDTGAINQAAHRAAREAMGFG